MDTVILVILRELELECYKQIAIEQRDGRAIEERVLEDMPGWESFKDMVPPSKTNTERAIKEPPTIKRLADRTLADIINESDPSNQITVDELIEAGGDIPRPEFGPAPEPEQRVDKSRKTAPSILDKIRSYLTARSNWYVEKYRKENEYECKKQQVKDRVYGFKHMAQFINRYISDITKSNRFGDESDEEGTNLHPV